MLTALKTLAQDYDYTYMAPTTTGADAQMSPIMVLFWLAFAVLMLVSLWKVFQKAGRPGWAAIVPIYNQLQSLWMVGRPWWWLLLICIPFIGIVFAVIATHDTSKAFGRGVGTTLLLLFLPFIGFPILAFGKDQYIGPVADPNFKPSDHKAATPAV